VEQIHGASLARLRGSFSRPSSTKEELYIIVQLKVDLRIVEFPYFSTSQILIFIFLSPCICVLDFTEFSPCH